jgi:glutaredoxin
VRSLLFIAGIGGALLGCRALRAESASAADDRQTRCIVVELYVSGSEATPPEALIREELQSRPGIQLRRFDISGDAPAADRWRQIRERFQLSEATLPAVYSGGEVVTNDGDEQAFRRKLESLFQLTVFVRSGCPHCADAKGHLQTIKRQYSGLSIVFRDLATDKSAGTDLQALVQRYRKSAVSVPVFHVFNQLVVGFDNTGSAARRLDKVLSQWSVPCNTTHRDSEAKRRAPSSASQDRLPLDPNRPGESDVVAETPDGVRCARRTRSSSLSLVECFFRRNECGTGIRVHDGERRSPA